MPKFSHIADPFEAERHWKERAEAAERERDEALVAEHHMNVERDDAIMDGLRYKRQRDEAMRERDEALRERDEARAKAEELRRPLLRRVALDAALNGQQATVPPELRFPWEDGDSG